MELTEAIIDRWLDRGGKLFRALARNPVVRSTLLARGLTDDELDRGWALYGAVLGFKRGGPARPAEGQTEASAAIDYLDAWDQPWFNATHAVLEGRFPDADRFLFDDLKAEEGILSVQAVEQYLDRLALLRAGKAPHVEPEAGRAAAELLATRGIVTAVIEAQLREKIAAVRRGARPEEVVSPAEADPDRQQAARAYIAWCHEWREVARACITRRDYQISLGLAQRRGATDDIDADDVDEPEQPATGA
jgi:hypothetical protein